MKQAACSRLRRAGKNGCVDGSWLWRTHAGSSLSGPSVSYDARSQGIALGSALRFTTLPSRPAPQDERSQHKNKAKALKVLRARLYEAEQAEQQRQLSK